MTYVFYHSEKVEIARYYVGELCDIMVYYESQRKIVILAFFVALFLKLFNNYFYMYFELHIEAKQKNMVVSKMVK